MNTELQIRARSLSCATAGVGVRHFEKLVQELADHPCFPEAERANIDQLREVPELLTSMNEKMSASTATSKIVADAKAAREKIQRITNHRKM